MIMAAAHYFGFTYLLLICSRTAPNFRLFRTCDFGVKRLGMCGKKIL